MRLFLKNLYFSPCSAIRESFRAGYSWADFRSDLMAGIVVGMVALPLGMALAIATGVAPQNGIYTVIIAGAIVALLGGSRTQVSGPTAAFVVILAPISVQHGIAGLLTAGFLSGLILVLMGIGGLGKLIQYIPYPVTTGFTSAIALVIGTLQIKDALGLKLESIPDHYIEKLAAIYGALGTFQADEILITAFTLLILITWPRVSRRIPAPLVALVAATLLSYVIQSSVEGFQIATINNRFSFILNGLEYPGIPQSLPKFTWPWQVEAPNAILSFSLIRTLLPSAFAIALLAAIESLLSAVVADGMTRTRHNPNSELFALGVGNIISPLFGGIAATGAIARTATNIRFGARSPIAAIVHSFFVLLVILTLAPLVAYVPMAALAALLLIVAYNMAELHRVKHIFKIAPLGDIVVFTICFGLTALFDMVVGVSVGVVLASLLFMRRMAEMTEGHELTEQELQLVKKLPRTVMLYNIDGPLFFGAADKAIGAISTLKNHIQTVIFTLDGVSVMDLTGLVAFESAVRRLLKDQKQVILVGLQRQPRKVLARSKLLSESGLKISDSLDQTLNELRIAGI